MGRITNLVIPKHFERQAVERGMVRDKVVFDVKHVQIPSNRATLDVGYQVLVNSQH